MGWGRTGAARAQGLPAAADSAQARTFAPPAAPARPPHLVLDLTTSNRTAYLNRVPDRDLDYGYLGTTLTYQTRAGWFGGLYLNHSYGPDDPVFDDYETTVGYARSGGATEWSAQYTRLFVPASSTLVRAAITDNLNGMLAHDFDLVYASLTADVFRLGGPRYDVVLTWDVSRQVQLAAFGRDTLSLVPTFELGTGTQHFYAAELARPVRERITRTKKNGQPGRPQTKTVLVEPDTPGFTTTGYTVSLPLTLELPRASVTLAPALLVPLHVPAGGNPDRTFYVSLNFTRRFW